MKHRNVQCLTALAALAMATAVSAQQAEFTVPPVKTLAQAGVGTTMDIVSTAPLKATFVWKNMGANFLGTAPTEIQTTAVKDATKPGMANNAFFASAPAFFNRYSLCISVAGPNTWAGIEENKKYDLAKMPCTKITGSEVSVSLGFAKADTYAIVPVIVDETGKFIAWGFHAEGATKRILTRPDMTKDMATVIHASASAPVAAANNAQFTAYQGAYTCFWSTSGACAAKQVAAK